MSKENVTRYFEYMVQSAAFDFDRGMVEILDQNAAGLEEMVAEYHEWLDTIEEMAKTLEVDFEGIRERTTWVPVEHQQYSTKVVNYGVDFALRNQEKYTALHEKYKEFEVSGGYTMAGEWNGLADMQLEVVTKEQAMAIYAEVKEMIDEEKGEYCSWYALNQYGFQVEEE